MDFAGLILKIVMLAGPPMAFLLGILKAQTYWPAAFFTFVGTTICAINFRIAGTLADLNPQTPLIVGTLSGELYRLFAWIVCPIILLVGIRKLLRMRAAQALAELNLDEE